MHWSRCMPTSSNDGFSFLKFWLLFKLSSTDKFATICDGGVNIVSIYGKIDHWYGFVILLLYSHSMRSLPRGYYESHVHLAMIWKFDGYKYCLNCHFWINILQKSYRNKAILHFYCYTRFIEDTPQNVITFW